MASSSSISPFALTLSSHSSKYHVFLSFRGVDVRKTFVDHLYSALEEKGIITFKDDERLPRGEIINSSLMKAIEESYIAVVIFSENYADSPWCLDELEFIMNCWDTIGKTVIPIFYNVKPSTVRKQKWKYAIAFLKYKLKNNKKVESWRKALVKASNISGWETKHVANGHESKCIKVIVEAIIERLRQDASGVNRLSVHDHLVGIEAPTQLLKSNLQIGLGGVRMIGIVGMGGSGKTTLASSVYDEISGMFDSSDFIENIREESSKTDGLKELQINMISGLLKQKQVHAKSVEEGRHAIMSRLGRKKVLIVLDDVDRLDQLEALAGSENWFGEGSRIIITSRNEDLLVAHRVNLIHRIGLLNDNQAMELFHKHAFRNGRPRGDYEVLSKDVVSYACGLPLALKVLGGVLHGKSANQWTRALARWKEFPDASILEKLKISYDGLEPVEKRWFLYMARFFRGEHTHEGVIKMRDNWGSHHVRASRVLIRKGLISVSDGKFVMHDLIQEMAHYIIREEQLNSPHKHSGVWKQEDDINTFSMNATKVGANMKGRRWFGLNVKQRVKATYISGPYLIYRVQKQLWRIYKADDHDMLMPQAHEMDYHNSLIPGNCGTSHGNGQTADYDDEDGDTMLTPVPNEIEKIERVEREILKRLEKGKNKVEMEVVDLMDTLEDRIVSRIEGVVHKRMDMLESMMMERMDVLENRMMEGMVVKEMERLRNKTVQVEEGVAERLERLTNVIVEMEREPDNKEE